MSLAALLCTAAALSPISWLEYYIALEVPYMALAYIAVYGRGAEAWCRRAAKSVLVIAAIFNLSTRLWGCVYRFLAGARGNSGPGKMYNH